MLPGTYDLVLYRGDTKRWRCTLWSDSARTIPTSLTGATVAAEIRDRPGGTIVKALTTAITLPNIIDVSISGTTQWANVPASGAWDLQVTYASGHIHTPLAGSVTVTPDVTASSATTMAASAGVNPFRKVTAA